MLKDFALEYFSLGNGITAFYVVQTILFLYAIPREPKLLSALCNDRQRASHYTWVIATIYCVLVIGCAVLEIFIYFFGNVVDKQKCLILFVSLCAMIGRVFLICFLAFLCSKLIKNFLKDES